MKAVIGGENVECEAFVENIFIRSLLGLSAAAVVDQKRCFGDLLCPNHQGGH
jgi:hypothetical protein